MLARLLLALVVVIPAMPGIAAGAARCPGGRFVIASALRTASQPAMSAVVVDGREVSIDGFCGPARMRTARARGGVTVRARWDACDALGGAVRLKARIDRACGRMTGMVRARATAVRWRFQALRDAVCGNGIREGDEACDEQSACCASCQPTDAPGCAPAPCTADLDCADGTYCSHPEACGVGGGAGVCRPRPEACIGVLEPVCGCDGRTYVNACEAARAGVDVLLAGHCPRNCGTIAGLRCPAGSFCEFPPRTCGAADLPGTCRPQPDACLHVYRPVCGCDGTTYGNDCERQVAGVSRAHAGTCDCTPPTCSPGTRAVDTNGDGCPDRCAPGDCDGNDDCDDREYCAAAGRCDGPGECAARPTACTREHVPVCGCDGQTYANACVAAASGIRVASRGPCECPPILCASGRLPVDGDGDGCEESCRVPCRRACDCYNVPGLEFSTPCPLACPTCGNYWACEDGFCADRCGPVPPGQAVCEPPSACRSNDDCADGGYCAREPGACHAGGTCSPRPDACPLVIARVCGCDGKTYSSACEAAASGTNVAARGACPRVCGTIAGLGCEPKEFCDFGAGQCRTADAAGVCVGVPGGCPEVYQPVCGCDGVTYDNDCDRRARRAQKAHDGTCACGPFGDCTR